MEKSPFERVFSLVDRRKLLQRAAKEEIQIVLKNSSGKISEMKVQGYDKDFNLEGSVAGHPLNDFDKVTALFQIDGDRYLLTTRVKKKLGYYLLLNDVQFFKFNRRAAFRIKVPTSLQLTYQIQSMRNIEINKKVSVIEFSSRGARFYMPEGKLSKGAVMKGALEWGKGKTIPVDSVMVHSPEKGIYAVRFANLKAATENRLKMLSIEIQQTIYFK